MLKSLQKSVQLFFAGKQKIKAQHLGRIENLSDVSSTVLFFSINSVDELDNVRSLLNKKKKAAKLLTAYVFFPGYHNLDIITDKHIFLFNLSDFTLFAKMKDSLRAKVKEASFELLISFVQSPDPFCLRVISEINAGFKVGVYQSNLASFYDFTINTDIKKLGFEKYYEQVANYLGVLNIRNKQ